MNASPLARMLAEQAGEEVDRAGRLTVQGDLSVPGHPEVLAVGDMVSVRQPDGSALVLPGVAPVAMQQGRHAARVVADRLAGRDPSPSTTPTRATSPPSGAPARWPTSRACTSAASLAWVTWLVVHLWYLIGFQNRLLVVIRWAVSFFTHGRGARLIAHD